MLAPATYATMLGYLLSLGKRHVAIANSEFTTSGEASDSATYPLVLVEIDATASELLGPGGQPVGADTFTFAIQVLDTPARSDAALVPALLSATNEWADQLTEQLRQELPGQLAGVSKLAIPGIAGSDLATGWRLELQVKLAKNLNRTTNGSLFAPL